MKFIINNNKKDSNIVFYNHAIKKVYVDTSLTSIKDEKNVKDVKDVNMKCNLEILERKKNKIII